MNSSSCYGQVSLIHVPDLPIPPSPTTGQALDIAFARYPSARRVPHFPGLGFTLRQQARRRRPAESSSLSYGWIVHLLLLPTPPHGDAVAFGYRPESVCLERTLTSLIMCAFRRTARRVSDPSGSRSTRMSVLIVSYSSLVTCDRSIDLSPQKIRKQSWKSDKSVNCAHPNGPGGRA